MKRYVKEFAADQRKSLEQTRDYCKKYNVGADFNLISIKLDRIAEILTQCEYGYISDFEAVKLLTKL